MSVQFDGFSVLIRVSAISGNFAVGTVQKLGEDVENLEVNEDAIVFLDCQHEIHNEMHSGHIVVNNGESFMSGGELCGELLFHAGEKKAEHCRLITAHFLSVFPSTNSFLFS